MQTPLLVNERIIKQGVANLQRGVETVGGKLYLTNQRLVFEAHQFNVQTGATLIPITTIAAIEASWTKFLNLLPLLPNSITISTRNHQDYHLLVFSRKAWITAITAAITEQRSE